MKKIWILIGLVAFVLSGETVLADLDSDEDSKFDNSG